MSIDPTKHNNLDGVLKGMNEDQKNYFKNYDKKSTFGTHYYFVYHKKDNTWSLVGLNFVQRLAKKILGKLGFKDYLKETVKGKFAENANKTIGPLSDNKTIDKNIKKIFDIRVKNDRKKPKFGGERPAKRAKEPEKNQVGSFQSNVGKQGLTSNPSLPSADAPTPKAIKRDGIYSTNWNQVESQMLKLFRKIGVESEHKKQPIVPTDLKGTREGGGLKLQLQQAADRNEISKIAHCFCELAGDEDAVFGEPSDGYMFIKPDYVEPFLASLFNESSWDSLLKQQ